MWTMSLISETSSDAFFQLMFLQDSNASKARMSCIFAVLTSMELQLKSKLYSRKKHQNRCAIIIIRSMLRYINGSILASTTSEEQALNGILRSLNKFSWASIRTIRFINKRWCNAIARTVIYGLLIDMSLVLAHSAVLKMLVEINAINAKRLSTPQPNF